MDENESFEVTPDEKEIFEETDKTLEDVTSPEETKMHFVADEVVDVPAKTERSGPEVVGAMTPEELASQSFDEVNICVECTWFGPIDKGVAFCPACGGKTTRGLRRNINKIKETDAARFNGTSAMEPKVND